MSNLQRRGRPPRVQETDRGYAVTVKGETYEFKADEKGNLRPLNTRNGDAESRDYAKSVVRRSLTSE